MFIMLRTIDSTDVKHKNADINAQLFKEKFTNMHEKQRVLENALESLEKSEGFSIDDWVFTSRSRGLLIDVKEISYMSEILPTIDRVKLPEKFWLIPTATEIILKNGTKIIVKDGICEIKKQMGN